LCIKRCQVCCHVHPFLDFERRKKIENEILGPGRRHFGRSDRVEADHQSHCWYLLPLSRSEHSFLFTTYSSYVMISIFAIFDNFIRKNCLFSKINVMIKILNNLALF
jgi:hypothetical protein